MDGKIDWVAVTATYIGIPIFLAIWLGYRLVRKTRFVRYADMHFPPLPPARGTQATGSVFPATATGE